MLRSRKNLVLILTVFSLIFVLTANVNAAEKPAVAVFIDYPQEYLRNQECGTLLNDKAEMLFPAQEYNLLPLDTVQTEIRAYREEKEIPHADYYYEKRLIESQVLEIAQKLKADYVLYLRFENADASVDRFFMNSAKINLTCNMAWFDVQEGKCLSTVQVIRGMDYQNNDREKSYTAVLAKLLANMNKETFM